MTKSIFIMSAFGSPHCPPPPPSTPLTGLMLITCRPTDTLHRKSEAHRLLHSRSHIKAVPMKRTWLLNWLYRTDRSKMTEVRFHKLMQAEWDSFHPVSCPERGWESSDKLWVQRTVEQIFKFTDNRWDSVQQQQAEFETVSAYFQKSFLSFLQSFT